MQSIAQKWSVFSVIITSLLLLSSTKPSFSANLCNSSDKNTLLNIKSHFNNASVFATWDPNTNCCNSWLGIECDMHGRVTKLAVINDDDAVGEIPAIIGNLQYLQFLQISVFFHLSGSIPPTLVKLTNLNHLNLNNNNLTGPIPDFLARFTSLSTLDLSYNSFTGSIPPSFGQLTKLKSLNLGANKLSGPIPASLGQLKSLGELYLYENKLSGPLPPSLASLPSLYQLYIRENKLTGAIPASFGSFKNPDLNIDLSYNSLTGPIPAAFGKANITLLDLSNNNLTGDTSFIFSRDKTLLYYINLSNNQFKFDISKVGLSRAIKKLDISHNKIYGSLPKDLGQLALTTFDVSFNQLCGQIPTGRRLKQFDIAVFSNNKCLCGAPLPACSS